MKTKIGILALVFLIIIPSQSQIPLTFGMGMDCYYMYRNKPPLDYKGDFSFGTPLAVFNNNNGIYPNLFLNYKIKNHSLVLSVHRIKTSSERIYSKDIDFDYQGDTIFPVGFVYTTNFNINLGFSFIRKLKHNFSIFGTGYFSFTKQRYEEIFTRTTYNPLWPFWNSKYLIDQFSLVQYFDNNSIKMDAGIKYKKWTISNWFQLIFKQNSPSQHFYGGLNMSYNFGKLKNIK